MESTIVFYHYYSILLKLSYKKFIFANYASFIIVYKDDLFCSEIHSVLTSSWDQYHLDWITSDAAAELLCVSLCSEHFGLVADRRRAAQNICTSHFNSQEAAWCYITATSALTELWSFHLHVVTQFTCCFENTVNLNLGLTLNTEGS